MPLPEPIQQLLEALPDAALSVGGAQMDHSNWIFIAIPIFVNLAVFAYYFGGLAQRIRVLESDFEKMVQTYTRVDDRTHALAVVMGKVETQMAAVCDHFRNHPAECPLTTPTRLRNRINENTAIVT
jgi:hypothetical protein